MLLSARAESNLNASLRKTRAKSRRSWLASTNIPNKTPFASWLNARNATMKGLRALSLSTVRNGMRQRASCKPVMSNRAARNKAGKSNLLCKETSGPLAGVFRSV